MPESNTRSSNGGSVTEYSYTVLFQPEPEGGFNVLVPAIPEICTFGDTLEKARQMAQDAIRLVLESSREHGEPIPQDIPPLTEQIAVKLFHAPTATLFQS